MLGNSIKEPLTNETQFWNGEKTLKELAEKYFNKNDQIKWPEVFKVMQDDGHYSFKKSLLRLNQINL